MNERWVLKHVIQQGMVLNAIWQQLLTNRPTGVGRLFSAKKCLGKSTFWGIYCPTLGKTTELY